MPIFFFRNYENLPYVDISFSNPIVAVGKVIDVEKKIPQKLIEKKELPKGMFNNS